jgi:hypothetical protein
MSTALAAGSGQHGTLAENLSGQASLAKQAAWIAAS